MKPQIVLIYIDRVDIKKRQQVRREVEQAVTRVLSTYPHAILAEVTDDQAAALKNQGYTLEPQVAARMIRLRAVEIDTTMQAPEMPRALSLERAERARRESDYWIVQFIGPVKVEWSEQVRELGAELVEYVPENAFLAKLPAGAIEQIKALEFVNWVGAYEPAYKVSPLLMGRRRPAAGAEIAGLSIQPEAFQPKPAGNLTFLLHRSSDRNKISKAIASKGGTVVNAEGDTIIASLDPAVVDQFAKMVEVKWIEPFELPVLHNNVSAPIIGVQDVWDNHGLDGEGQIVSVADTGLDTGVNDATMHDDFEGRVVSIHDRVGDGANDVNSGHGTHVAGSVLGNGARSNSTVRGMAPTARLVFQAIERNSNENLDGIPADYNQLFQQAYDDGARIHTNSWGNHQHGQYTAASQDIDEFMWNHKDAVILFSASNDGIDSNSDGVIELDSLSAQASAKNCITVGATEGNRLHGSNPPPGYDINWATGTWAAKYPVAPISNDHVSNNPEGMAAFSGRGPTDDGRVKPDVVAPGTNILSVRSSAVTGTPLWGDLAATDTLHDLYCWSGGTSMSTPLTAGSVALIRQYLQRVCLHNSPSGALLKAVLIHGAAPITGQYTPSEVGAVPDNSQGWGRVNLRDALFPAFPVCWRFRDNAGDAVGTGENRDYTFQVTNGTVPFRATLVWTDFPSNPTGAIGLVNQLRLSIIAPDGTTTQGAPANNNVQQVVSNNPQTGNYTVRVSGINVPTLVTQGQRQDFAVVVSAGLDFVDLYIKDNAADTGVAPTVGVEYLSPDIWVSLTNDPSAAPAANPEYGQTNYVFVRVHNRGSRAANNATVKLYWANPGTNLSRPYWNTADISVNGSPGYTQTVTVPAHAASGDGHVITQAFEWNPPEPDTNVYDEGHFCLFASVDHPDDPLLQEDVSAVRWESNLAWKNLVVKDIAANSITAMDFYVAGKQGGSALADLHIDRSGLPQGGSVTLKIPGRYLEGANATNLAKTWESDGGRVCKVEVTSPGTADLRRVHLESRENTLVRLEVTMPPQFQPGDVYPVFVEQYTDGAITGRVTLVARMVGSPAYLANRNSGEIHLPNCVWAKKISARHRVPFDDLNLALNRGYNGCHFCLPDYSTD